VEQLLDILKKLLRVLWVGAYRGPFLRTRVAASVEHDQVLAGLNLNTVVDIGANRGQFALCVRHLYPQAQIYSFEPLQKPAESWRRNFGADPRARLFSKAIAAASGPATMNVSRWDSSSSLLPITAAQSTNYPFTQKASTEQVETATLDSCLDAGQITGVALLKLDVQGSELAALHGCATLFDRFRYAYVEASFIELYEGQALATDVIRFMLANGFDLISVANPSRGAATRPIQADFLFEKAGSPARAS
jgi:FkbM family methyltransferase